jgi:halocyanin-like protein
MTPHPTRRQVLAAGGAALGATATLPGRAVAQPDLAEYLSNTDGADEVVDRTGESAVEIAVGTQGNGGAFAFDPVVVRVDPGTEVTWRWTGEGGSHNVVAADGTFGSDLHGAEGTTFTYTPSEVGVYPYACTPHETVGMKGGLVVGDVTTSIGGGEATATPTTAPGEDEGGDDAGSSTTEPETPPPSKQPFGGWLAETEGFDGLVDRTGEDVVVVGVGAAGNGGRFGFGPPAVRVDPGTTVVWEWLVDGVAHDVRERTGAFESEDIDQVGERYAVTFEGERVWKYECTDHSERGMRGVVVVGRPNRREDGGAAAVLGGLGLLGLMAAAAQSMAGDDEDAAGSEALEPDDGVAEGES